MRIVSPRSIRFLPGARGPEPRVLAHQGVAAEVDRARRRADASELLDLMILIVINLFFMQWQGARLPFLSRDASLLILLATNAAYVLSWVRSRLVPLWQTRRIATSWSEDEQKRLRYFR